MGSDSEQWHRQLRTGLTTIKLAVQLLQRRPGLGGIPEDRWTRRCRQSTP